MPSPTFFHLPQAKRERLLQCARDEFSRFSFDEASINRIVRQAEIARGSFYMYFTDKEDLFRYLLQCYLDELTQMLQTLLDREQGDLFAAFSALFQTLVEQRDSPSAQQFHAILHRNAGVQQGALLRSASTHTLFSALSGHIDRSRLSLRRAEDLEDMFHILISVTAPALCAALSHTDPQIAWARLQAQLDILRRGMEAREAPAGFHHE